MMRIALKQRLCELWQKLKHLNATPDQIATGFSIGIFASFLPLNPSPIIVATVAAWLLRRNVIAAVAGAVASILYVPLLPLIWLAEYRLGKLILPVKHPLKLDHARLWDVLQQGWDVYAAMFVGSILIAIPVTLLTYLIVKRLAEKWAQQKMAKRTTVNHVRFRTGALVWILLVASRGAAQTQSPDLTATELVRQTVAHELAVTNTGGQYMCRVHEETPQGSETRVMVEIRNLEIGRLILKNSRPLSPAQRQREEERLRTLLTNRALLLKYQTEQNSDVARLQRVIQVLPDAFVYQYAGAEKDDSGCELALVAFRPNPDYRARSLELRVLQVVEGAMLIDTIAKRFVRVEAKLCQDVDFGWGIIDHISRGGSFLLEQRVVWHDQWAMTTFALHYTNRLLLLITSRADSKNKVSDFRRMPDDLTQQQALEMLLDPDPMTAAVPGAGKTP
jgi:uncharacterized protein (DUF2062 family)